MSSSNAHGVPFNGVRVRVQSEKTYDELVAALLADVGEIPASIGDFPARAFDSWERFSAEVTRYIGPDDFMLMHVIDHGQWLKTAGIQRKALRAIIGNPLIAITMIRHDLTAGLFAPVELLVVEEDDGRSSLTYVTPSTLMVIEDNPPLRTAALALDAKLAAFATKVAATAEPA
ncbi:MAG: DUF302 domain-containing protein [Mycobacterium sp.]|nr:DUF302 domain-containing protein [Mycobacterium sp.]